MLRRLPELGSRPAGLRRSVSCHGRVTPRGHPSAQHSETGHACPHKTGWTPLDGFYDMRQVIPRTQAPPGKPSTFHLPTAPPAHTKPRDRKDPDHTRTNRAAKATPYTITAVQGLASAVPPADEEPVGVFPRQPRGAPLSGITYSQPAHDSHEAAGDAKAAHPAPTKRGLAAHMTFAAARSILVDRTPAPDSKRSPRRLMTRQLGQHWISISTVRTRRPAPETAKINNLPHLA